MIGILKFQKDALLWIIDLLEVNDIPFIISGGLAAKIYGATRNLNDIDIGIEDKNLRFVSNIVSAYIIEPLQDYSDSTFTVKWMSLKYHLQEIEVFGINSAKIYDYKIKKWSKLPLNIHEVERKKIFSRTVNVIPKDILVAYKRKILYEKEKHQQDINEIS